MSLTQEQQRELDQLNELFRKFDHQMNVSDIQSDELVHQFMMEEFPLVNLEKAQLEVLAEKRQALLKKRSTSPIQTVSSEGDIQLEF
jgi:NifB/MoaA-like Fe-S oxidoreductase